jgi:hypothetical protein
MDNNQTISYIAQPVDKSCMWWSAKLNNLTVDNLVHGVKIEKFQRGQVLELKQGEMIIDCESNHRRHNRGFTFVLGVVLNNVMVWIKPSMSIKNHIKKNHGLHLMKGSGNFCAVVRMALWIREQTDLKSAVKSLKEIQ